MPQEQDHIELRSEHVQDILTAVPNWMIRWGNTLVLLLIIMLLCISWFVKYPDIIPSEALITTQIPPQKEYAKVTGRLSTLLVSDNEKVNNCSLLYEYFPDKLRAGRSPLWFPDEPFFLLDEH